MVLYIHKVKPLQGTTEDDVNLIIKIDKELPEIQGLDGDELRKKLMEEDALQLSRVLCKLPYLTYQKLLALMLEKDRYIKSGGVG